MATYYNLKQKKTIFLKGIDYELDELFEVVAIEEDYREKLQAINGTLQVVREPIFGTASYANVYFDVKFGSYRSEMTEEGLISVEGSLSFDGPDEITAFVRVFGESAAEDDWLPLDQFSITFSEELDPGNQVELSLEDHFWYDDVWNGGGITTEDGSSTVVEVPIDFTDAFLVVDELLISEESNSVDFSHLSEEQRLLVDYMRPNQLRSSLGGNDDVTLPVTFQRLYTDYSQDTTDVLLEGLTETLPTGRRVVFDAGDGRDKVTVPKDPESSIYTRYTDYHLIADTDGMKDTLVDESSSARTTFIVDSTDVIKGFDEGDTVYLRLEGDYGDTPIAPSVRNNAINGEGNTLVTFHAQIPGVIFGDEIGRFSLDGQNVDFRKLHYQIESQAFGDNTSANYLKISYESTINPIYEQAMKDAEALNEQLWDTIFKDGVSIVISKLLGRGAKALNKDIAEWAARDGTVGGYTDVDDVVAILQLTEHPYTKRLQKTLSEAANKILRPDPKSIEGLLFTDEQAKDFGAATLGAMFAMATAAVLTGSSLLAAIGLGAAVVTYASYLNVLSKFLAYHLEDERAALESATWISGINVTGEKQKYAFLGDDTADGYVLDQNDNYAEIMDFVEGDMFLTGNSRDNILLGGAGNNLLLGNEGNDEVDGRGGHDRIDGGQGNDRIEGGKGKDKLDGGKGRDSVEGGGGRDSIEGGTGADRLTGGNGGDVFIFRSSRDSKPGTRDVISDFNRGEDVLRLKALNKEVDGRLAFIGEDGFSETPGEVRYKNSGLKIDIDGDGKADFSVKLSGVEQISESDLIL